MTTSGLGMLLSSIVLIITLLLAVAIIDLTASFVAVVLVVLLGSIVSACIELATLPNPV